MYISGCIQVSRIPGTSGREGTILGMMRKMFSQGHHELCGKSDENKSFQPNQTAPSDPRTISWGRVAAQMSYQWQLYPWARCRWRFYQNCTIPVIWRQSPSILTPVHLKLWNLETLNLQGVSILSRFNKRDDELPMWVWNASSSARFLRPYFLSLILSSCMHSVIFTWVALQGRKLLRIPSYFRFLSSS